MITFIYLVLGPYVVYVTQQVPGVAVVCINCPLEGITVPLRLQCSRILYHSSVHNFIFTDSGLSNAMVYECAGVG
jgi:hypothetical protein